MKRLKEVLVGNRGTGTFNYSNGMIGTRDLPAFVAETAYFRKRTSLGEQFMLGNIKCKVVEVKSWREQLAAVAKKLKL